MAVKGINGADLNNISRVDGRSNVLDKVNGIDADLSPPAVAFSVRNVSGLTGIPYDGPAMRILVDATGDGADATDLEFDIDFTADGDLDVADIELKCAGGKDAYVVKWYDQSGAGNDATQTSYAAMPKIATAGVVITENGKAAVSFDGAQSLTRSDAVHNGTGDMSAQAVFTRSSTFGNGLFQLGSGTLALWNMTSEWGYRVSGGNRLFASSSPVAGTQVLASMYIASPASTSTMTLFIDSNSVSPTSTNSKSINIANNLTAIGGNFLGHGGGSHNGVFQELIVWSSDQISNRTGIEVDINNHFAIGNLPNPTSGLLATYTGAAAAYSVRQLSNTAPLSMRVRRDTAGGTGDDDEADVLFDFTLTDPTISLDSRINNPSAGVASTTLGEFLNATGYTDKDNLTVVADGFCNNWYDQSGAGNDAEQTAFGSQPQIFDSASPTDLITENGKPAVDFDTGKQMDTGLVTSGDLDAFVVLSIDSGDTRAILLSDIGGSTGSYLLQSQSGSTNSNVTSGVFSVSNYYQNGASQTFSTRGDAYTKLSGQQNLIATDGTASIVGSIGLAYGGIAGYLTQEVIFWNSDQSSNRTGIETDINTYFSIF